MKKLTLILSLVILAAFTFACSQGGNETNKTGGKDVVKVAEAEETSPEEVKEEVIYEVVGGNGEPKCVELYTKEQAIRRYKRYLENKLDEAGIIHGRKIYIGDTVTLDLEKEHILYKGREKDDIYYIIKPIKVSDESIKTFGEELYVEKYYVEKYFRKMN